MKVIDIVIIGRHLRVTLDIGEPQGALGQDCRAIMTAHGGETYREVTMSCAGDEDFSDERKMAIWNELVARLEKDK